MILDTSPEPPARPRAARPAPPRPEDLATCRAILARGSKSFSAASRLLPARLRDSVAAFYAFCRVSDDLVDESPDPKVALAELEGRLDAIYAGDPARLAEDRALTWVVDHHRIPRVLLDALLEGYRWDAEGRSYATLSEVRAYGARVAGAVGVVMTLMMGPRDRDVLLRAADLGVAMQLTNIARDVGEDAMRGRVYLPSEWLEASGVESAAPTSLLRFEPGVGVVVARLLSEAERLYRRAELGIGALPADCRAAIWAARLIYADIGRVIAERGYESVSARAYTSTPRKAVLAAEAALRARAVPPLAVAPAPSAAPGLPETLFLVDDVAG